MFYEFLVPESLALGERALTLKSTGPGLGGSLAKGPGTGPHAVWASVSPAQVRAMQVLVPAVLRRWSGDSEGAQAAFFNPHNTGRRWTPSFVPFATGGDRGTRRCGSLPGAHRSSELEAVWPPGLYSVTSPFGLPQ